MPYTEFIFKISFESHTKFVLRKWVSAVYYHACRHFRAYLFFSIAINYLVYKYLQYGILERYARAIVIPSGLTGFFVPTLSFHFRSLLLVFFLCLFVLFQSYHSIELRDGLSWVTDVTRQSDRTGLPFFVSAVLIFTFILLFLPSSSVQLSYVDLAVPMRKCLREHSCVSSPFSTYPSEWNLLPSLYYKCENILDMECY